MEYEEDLRLAEQKGVQKGRAEANEEIARKMKKVNADYSFISHVTSIPVERIAQL
ncbi:MAG: hypothetical protein IJ228_10390 [Succinivibrio sp.]|nr:hypothetical protein [Succinivibrio sp.]